MGEIHACVTLANRELLPASAMTVHLLCFGNSECCCPRVYDGHIKLRACDLHVLCLLSISIGVVCNGVLD